MAVSKRWIFPALLLGAAASAYAQQPAQAPKTAAAAPALTQAQQAQIAGQNQQMVQAALVIAQMIDKGQIGEAWDGASPVGKQIASRKDFIKQITDDRKQLGVPTDRKLASLKRSQSAGGKIPAGFYISVAFATQFSKAKQPVRELISFHQDSDTTWRLAGYTLR